MNRFVVGFAAFLLTVAVYAGTGNNSKTGNPGGGSVTSVSSPNGTITVGSPTTTPTLDVTYPQAVPFSSSTVGSSFSNSGTPPITSGIWSKVTGSTLSSNTRNFNWGVSYSPNVNLPGDSRGDTVVSIGWNIKGDATCEDATDSCTRIGFEDHYLQAGVAPAANEIHLTTRDTGGTEHRGFSFFAPKNGGSGSSVAVGADVFNFFNYGATQEIKFDSVAKVISFPNGDFQTQYANNTQNLKQKNAAGSAFITLIYDDADDRVRIPNNFASVATTPTTGTYANQFAVFQATSMPSGGYVSRFVGPSITGSYQVGQFEGTATTGVNLNIKNGSTSSTADTAVVLSVGSSAAGNPYVEYLDTSSTGWFVGQHSSDLHAFKWATAAFGGTYLMRLGTDGGLTLGVPTGGDEGAGTINTAGNIFVNGTSIVPLSGTSASIGGSALLAGACSSGTVSITGATTSMAVVATPATYPGDGSEWAAYVSSANTVTVKVCAIIALTPTASTYNVRVIP